MSFKSKLERNQQTLTGCFKIIISHLKYHFKNHYVSCQSKGVNKFK